MIPSSIREYLPNDLIRDDNIAGTELCNEIDYQFAEWKSDITELGYLHTPDRCRANSLDELAYMLGYDPNVTTLQVLYCVDEVGDNLVDESGAYLVASTVYSVRQGENPSKRIGIQQAVKSYKTWDTFNNHIKPRIDSITGLSCAIYQGAMLVDESGDYLIDNEGRYLQDLGMGTTYIYIDLGGEGILTAEIVALVAQFLQTDCDLAFTQINIGYVLAGVFTSYNII